MQQARRHDDPSNAFPGKGAGAARPAPATGPRRGGPLRRIEERPALAVLTARAVGLLLWVGLFALIL